MAKATDGLAFGVTRHCRIEGLPPVPPTPLPVLELIFQLASYKRVDHWCFATCFFEGFDGEGEMLASLLFAEWDPCSYIDGEMAISTIAAVHWYTNMDVFVQRSSE